MAGIAFNIHGWQGAHWPLSFREDLTIASTITPIPLCGPLLQIKDLLPALKALTQLGPRRYEGHSQKCKARIIFEICYVLKFGLENW